jgi:hypothetical protein
MHKTATNQDLLAMLADALVGSRLAAGPLVDALKEAGFEEAGGKLHGLMTLHKEIAPRLEAARREVQEWDAEGSYDHAALESRAAEEARMEAYQEVLGFIGEEVPKERGLDGPMTRLVNLSRDDLVAIVEQIVLILYGQPYLDGKGREKVALNRAKVWDADTLQEIDQVLVEADLSPPDLDDEGALRRIDVSPYSSVGKST